MSLDTTSHEAASRDFRVGDIVQVNDECYPLFAQVGDEYGIITRAVFAWGCVVRFPLAGFSLSYKYTELRKVGHVDET